MSKREVWREGSRERDNERERDIKLHNIKVIIIISFKQLFKFIAASYYRPSHSLPIA